MKKSDITVTCFFSDDGEVAAQIIYRSFEFFLQRELMRDGHNFALSRQVQV